ncbi:YfgM family protein [Pseudomarimonas salicorniae]|uniref:Ancillary SecYEG translocon subunit n=1 Tax=Pseudomarimonas salicorniae TaxID=2933270 RepID=A0ABT0GG00_9GAMM|nr:tetratricopeptide repeat protein [Lysobacter sp. CAU 1642]MCK7592977.1 tetratricopeptide repeat protein [Lysobacter sp. CAU 1642]
MSMELMDEHEQGERVRAWLRENGASIVTGIAIGIAAIGGWQWWNAKERNRALEASSQFVAMTSAVEGGDRELAAKVAEVLSAEYERTPYAVLAGLTQAELQLEAGETQAAVETLAAARAQAADPLLADFTAVRLARAQIAAGNPQAALELLEGFKRGTALNARGDALLALGRNDEAVAAYKAALEDMDETLPTRRLVELKLLDLGVNNEEDEAQG